MNNEKVILAFLNGRAAHTPTRDINNGYYTYKGQTLKTNGLELINYSTRIAYKEKGNIYLNVNKYSNTTSHIQSKIRRLVESLGLNLIEYKEV